MVPPCCHLPSRICWSQERYIKGASVVSHYSGKYYQVSLACNILVLIYQCEGYKGSHFFPMYDCHGNH